MSLDVELDKLLKIKTGGRDDSNSNFTNYPYEATDYCVLQELSCSGYITKLDKIVDFGSGKGRVDFYLAYTTKAKMIGVEYDLRLYNRSIDNLSKAISKNRVSFVHSCASEYIILDDITGAYFFNPFSVHILKSVISNIKESCISCNREFKLFFYYPSFEYLTYLDNEDDIVHIEDIDCTNLFKDTDKRECIAVYKINL